MYGGGGGGGAVCVGLGGGGGRGADVSGCLFLCMCMCVWLGGHDCQFNSFPRIDGEAWRRQQLIVLFGTSDRNPYSELIQSEIGLRSVYQDTASGPASATHQATLSAGNFM